VRELRFAGTQALQQGDAARALTLLDEALTLKETDFNTHFARHEALLALARPADALSALDRALELKPSFLTARIARAQLHIAREAHELALADLNAVLAEKPTHPHATQLVRKLQSTRSATESVAALADDLPCAQVLAPLSSAIAALPLDAVSSVPLRLRRSRCLAETGDHSGVLDDTRRVLAIDANNVDALELRGHALYALGEDDAATQHFNKCLRMNPDSKSCKFHWKRTRALAKSLAAARDAKARSAWSELLDAVDATAVEANSSPDVPGEQRVPRDAVTGHIGRHASEGGVHRTELLVLRCIALAGVGSADAEAVNACGFAAHVASNDAEPLLARADVLRRLKRWDEAINDYNGAQQRDPNSRRAMHGKHDAERERKMATRKNYYAILGVEQTADIRDIKRAHRKLAAMYHPDKCSDPTEVELFEKRFLELGEAIEVLGDEAKRKQYDQGMDYEDIKKQEQHEHAQQHNPFQNQGFGGFQQGGFKFHF
jgi:tetratricopeptide (TPR) repeat protein